MPGGATASNIRAAADDIRRTKHNDYPPPEDPRGWYGKYLSSNGTIHVMLDKKGNPTTKYPHVHVIHDERGGKVVVVRSQREHNHPEKITLAGNASGNEVNAAIASMIAKL